MSKEVPFMAKKVKYIYKDGTVRDINSLTEIPLAGVVCYVDEYGNYFEEKVDENAFMDMLFSDDFGGDSRETSSVDVISTVYLSELQVRQKLNSIQEKEFREKIRVERPRRRLW